HTGTEKRSGCSDRRRTTGASLMASGRVPKTASTCVKKGGVGQLLVAIGDASLGQVIGRHFQGNPVACQHADAVAAKLAGQVGQHCAFLVKLYAEQAARKFFNNSSSYFNCVFFAH